MVCGRQKPTATVFPRRGMARAAGTRTRSAGRSASVPVMAPRVSPARRSPPEETSRAARPCRREAGSAPSRARKRAPARRANPRMTTRRFHHGGLQTCGRNPTGSALLLGAYSLDGDADEYALVTLHGLAVVVPVGVLAGDPPVVVDQAV